MDLKKKFNIPLISILGTGIILIFVFVGALVLQRNLAIQKVQASPGPDCTVSDNLVVSGNIDGGYALFTGVDHGFKNPNAFINTNTNGGTITIGGGVYAGVTSNVNIPGNLDAGCIGIEGGCLDGGQNKQCSASTDCYCDSGLDIAVVWCPNNYYVISGGCDSDSGDKTLSHNTWQGSPPDRWYCNWSGGVGWERAKAVCCRIKVNWDTTLKSMPSGNQ